jgi:putative aldouronate transport system permease protein
MRIKKRKFDLDNFQLWILAIIPTLAVIIFAYLPMGGIVIAFKDYNYRDGIFGSPWVGLDNFKFMLTTPTFARIAKNTIFMNILMIGLGTLSSVIMALLLFQFKSRTSTKIYQTVMITPHFLSWVVVSYMAYALLHTTNGTLNQLLEAVGMKPVDWYG